ncbi:hypothetical protein KKI22_00765 [Patescibacteria group bacterium]|nr:hypothetical protein [Patescibacteria group bacterium]
MSIITYEEAILETLPFPEELKDWCKKHPEFLEALKIITSSRFLHLGGVVHYHKDKVFGVYSYDYQINNPKFKQDFIEYSDVRNPTFTLYTSYIRKNNGSSKWVKDINEFFKKFDGYNKGISSHHLSLEELPSVLKEKGNWAIKKGEEFKKTGVRKLTDEELNKWLSEVKQVKKLTKWYIQVPLI